MARIVRLRLYRVQDYDLYAIYYDKKNFRLSKMFTAAVSAFANGRPLPVFSLKNITPLPKPVKADNGEVIRGSGLKFTLIMAFTIPDYDTKTIALIDYLTKEQTANSFLKTLVRRCFTDMEYMYLGEDVRSQFPDPGSMTMTTIVQPYTNNETKKPRKKKATRPKQPEGISAQGAVLNENDNTHVSASETRSIPNNFNPNTTSNKMTGSELLSGAEPSYIVEPQASHKINPESAYMDNTAQDTAISEKSSSNDLFSFAQGFEF